MEAWSIPSEKRGPLSESGKAGGGIPGAWRRFGEGLATSWPAVRPPGSCQSWAERGNQVRVGGTILQPCSRSRGVNRGGKQWGEQQWPRTRAPSRWLGPLPRGSQLREGGTVCVLSTCTPSPHAVSSTRQLLNDIRSEGQHQGLLPNFTSVQRDLGLRELGSLTRDSLPGAVEEDTGGRGVQDGAGGLGDSAVTQNTWAATPSQVDT